MVPVDWDNQPGTPNAPEGRLVFGLDDFSDAQCRLWRNSTTGRIPFYSKVNCRALPPPPPPAPTKPTTTTHYCENIPASESITRGMSPIGNLIVSPSVGTPVSFFDHRIVEVTPMTPVLYRRYSAENHNDLACVAIFKTFTPDHVLRFTIVNLKAESEKDYLYLGSLDQYDDFSTDVLVSSGTVSDLPWYVLSHRAGVVFRTDASSPTGNFGFVVRVEAVPRPAPVPAPSPPAGVTLNTVSCFAKAYSASTAFIDPLGGSSSIQLPHAYASPPAYLDVKSATVTPTSPVLFSLSAGNYKPDQVCLGTFTVAAPYVLRMTVVSLKTESSFDVLMFGPISSSSRTFVGNMTW